MHPQTPRKIQIWIRKWKQQKKNKLGYFLNLQHFEGKKGALELQGGD
jgi:hypothetical protein